MSVREYLILPSRSTPANGYLVMPVGLTSAHAVSQTVANEVLHDMLNIFVFVYLDILIFFFLRWKKNV